MPKDTPESTIRNAETLERMSRLLSATEGPAACSRWINYLINEAIKRRTDYRLFGYCLLVNIRAHIGNELEKHPEPISEGDIDDQKIQ